MSVHVCVCVCVRASLIKPDPLSPSLFWRVRERVWLDRIVYVHACAFEKCVLMEHIVRHSMAIRNLHQKEEHL